MNFYLLALFFELLILSPCRSKSLKSDIKGLNINIKSKAVNILSLSTVHSNAKLLPSPDPCQNAMDFCGGDVHKYPSRDIIESAIESITDVKNCMNQKNKIGTQKKGSEIDPACQSRRDTFPSFGRAKNIQNKWKYIINLCTNSSSNAELLICEKPGQPCKNDYDSPSGDWTTVCRQVYRKQYLLALDENGDASLDTFRLPSGCICHFISPLKTRIFSVNTIKPSYKVPTFNDESIVDLSKETVPCANGEDFCELLPSYPKTYVDRAVKNSHVNIALPSDEFKRSQRPGPSNGEIPLCASFTQIIHPQKGRNVHGIWRHIVNTDIYKQGVTIEKCLKNNEGKSCLYDNSDGIYPEATLCKQQHLKHPLVVILPTGDLRVELFNIPTACVCHITKSWI